MTGNQDRKKVIESGRNGEGENSPAGSYKNMLKGI